MGEYEELVNSIQKIQSQAIDDKMKLENQNLDQKLREVLADQDYTSLNNDLEVMKMLIDHDSEKLQLQQQKLFENLNNLYSSGKLTAEDFENVKKKIYKTLSLKK